MNISLWFRYLVGVYVTTFSKELVWTENYPSCSSVIHVSLQNLTSSLVSKSVPFGRIFAADMFGVGFFLRLDQPYIGSSKQISKEKKSYKVDTCFLTSYDSKFSANSCNISFYARLIGPEILMGHIFHKKDEFRGVCVWTIDFPDITISGDYELEIRMMWLNEMDEPTHFYNSAPSDARYNEGRIIHVGGTGEFPLYKMDFLWRNYFNSGINVILRKRGRFGNGAYWLIINGTKHVIENKAALNILGVDISRILDVPEHFLLNGFPYGGVLKRPNVETLLRSNRFRVTAAVPEAVREQLTSTGWLVHGQEPMLQSLVFGLPKSPLRLLAVTDEQTAASSTNRDQKAIAQTQVLPYCTRGDVSGRWVREHRCDFASEELEECSHAALPPAPERIIKTGGIISEKYTARGMVWRPYFCKLDHHSVCSGADVRCLERFRLADPSTYLNPVTGNYSSWSACMEEAGVGFLAGFGDSIGADLGRYVARSVDEPSGKAVNGSAARGLVCGHATSKQSWDGYAHFLLNTVDLRTCIEESTRKMVEEQRATAGKKATRKKTTVVLITNFEYSHALKMSLRMDNISYYLHQQAAVHADLAQFLRNEYGLRYRRIFFSTAVHGHRFAGLTPGRKKLLTDLAKEILVPSGWEILDSYNITLARPDGTSDGMHYRSGVTAAIVDLLLTVICHG